MTGMPYKEKQPLLPSSLLYTSQYTSCRHMCVLYQMLYMLCTCLVVCNDPTNVLMSANWPARDSFRTVNYAIMLGLDRICSHCALLHIIDRPSVSQHLVLTHIIIPLMIPAILWELFQASKNTQNKLEQVSSRSCRSVLLGPPDVPCTGLPSGSNQKSE